MSSLHSNFQETIFRLDEKWWFLKNRAATWCNVQQEYSSSVLFLPNTFMQSNKAWLCFSMYPGARMFCFSNGLRFAIEFYPLRQRWLPSSFGRKFPTPAPRRMTKHPAASIKHDYGSNMVQHTRWRTSPAHLQLDSSQIIPYFPEGFLHTTLPSHTSDFHHTNVFAAPAGPVTFGTCHNPLLKCIQFFWEYENLVHFCHGGPLVRWYVENSEKHLTAWCCVA